MMFEQIPLVVVDLNADRSRKFVVAEISDGAGSKKIIVRAGAYYAHCEGYQYLEEELERGGIKDKFGKLGGGSFSVRNKVIRVFDYSFEFGQEPDRQLTGRLIQEAYPDHKVEIA